MLDVYLKKWVNPFKTCLAPPPLPLLVGVLNTTSPSFGSGWHATFIRVKSPDMDLWDGVTGVVLCSDGFPDAVEGAADFRLIDF